MLQICVHQVIQWAIRPLHSSKRTNQMKTFRGRCKSPFIASHAWYTNYNWALERHLPWTPCPSVFPVYGKRASFSTVLCWIGVSFKSSIGWLLAPSSPSAWRGDTPGFTLSMLILFIVLRESTDKATIRLYKEKVKLVKLSQAPSLSVSQQAAIDCCIKVLKCAQTATVSLSAQKVATINQKDVLVTCFIARCNDTIYTNKPGKMAFVLSSLLMNDMKQIREKPEKDCSFGTHKVRWLHFWRLIIWEWGIRYTCYGAKTQKKNL